MYEIRIYKENETYLDNLPCNITGNSYIYSLSFDDSSSKTDLDFLHELMGNTEVCMILIPWEHIIDDLIKDLKIMRLQHDIKKLDKNLVIYISGLTGKSLKKMFEWALFLASGNQFVAFGIGHPLNVDVEERKKKNIVQSIFLSNHTMSIHIPNNSVLFWIEYDAAGLGVIGNHPEWSYENFKRKLPSSIKVL